MGKEYKEEEHKEGKYKEEGKSEKEEEGKAGGEGSPSSLGRSRAAATVAGDPTARILHQPESGFPKPDNQTKPVSRVMMMMRMMRMTMMIAVIHT